MTQDNIAILCAGGIGDGLLMTIAAKYFFSFGYRVTLFSPWGKQLAPLFPAYQFSPTIPLCEMKDKLSSFARVIVQNDHSEQAYFLFDWREEEDISFLIFFLPTSSHRQRKGDILFDKKFPMATNIARACVKLVPGSFFSKCNGLITPKGKEHRRFFNRIAIHPTSQKPDRSWEKERYIQLAEKLKKRLFSITFIVSPKERAQWDFIERKGIALFTAETLKEVAAYLYESGFFIGNDSGIGHLASNLGLPTLTISPQKKRVRMWRPDWHCGEIVTPLFPLPNFKGIGWRFREEKWSKFVSVDRVLHLFSRLQKKSIKVDRWGKNRKK